METQVGTEKTSAPQATVQVDTTLKSLFIKEQQSYGEIVKYVKENIIPGKDLKIAREIVRKTLMEARGLSSASAGVVTSNIMSLCEEKHAQVLTDLLDGKITVAQSRKLAQQGSNRGAPSKTPPAELTPEQQYANNWRAQANSALLLKKSKDVFLKEAAEIYDDVVKVAAEAAAQQAKQQGSVDATPPAPAPAPAPAAKSNKKAA
jgi:hypothetical protein